MAEVRDIQAVVQKATTTVVAPMALGFGDCLALLLGFLLMLVAALSPGAARQE
jgi:hypothetical protein